MLKFNEYLKEENEDVLDVDTRLLENNREALNNDLDVLTKKPYQNAPIFLSQLRGTLERYGMILPQEASTRMLFLRIDEKDYSALKAFLIYTSAMPKVVRGIRGGDIISSDIPLDTKIVNILRNL
jgi:hypothetical protein